MTSPTPSPSSRSPAAAPTSVATSRVNGASRPAATPRSPRRPSTATSPPSGRSTAGRAGAGSSRADSSRPPAASSARQVNNGRVRYLDDAERARLLAACRVAPWSRLYLLVLMAITTGARRGELLALTWRDLDLERREAYVRDQQERRAARARRSSRRSSPRSSASARAGPDDFVFASDKRPGPRHAHRARLPRRVSPRRGSRTSASTTCGTAARATSRSTARACSKSPTSSGTSKCGWSQRYAHLSVESKRRLVDRVLGDVK